jgi:hypothetical protein
MNIYIPFTYIIGWSEHKKFYYGAKYAQGCNPKDLWESYFTSSEYVKEFREKNGEPDIIKIHRTFSDKESCVLFESEYLTKIDAKNKIIFLNQSNGNGKSFSKKTVTNKEKEKRKKTNLKKYGVENVFQDKTIKEKSKQTMLEKYESDHPSKCLIIKEKKKQTFLEIYGVDNPNKSQKIKNKKKETFLLKLGYDNSLKSPEVREKGKETCRTRYGVDHISKLETICKYCNELKGFNHQAQCNLNPNKTLVDRSGSKNSTAKKVIVNGILYGSLREAAKDVKCDENNLRKYLKGRKNGFPKNIWELRYYEQNGG